MASALIHIAVANELNKELKKDTNKFVIGSIGPDIAKIIGISRDLTHFEITEEDKKHDYPNLEAFLNKYENKLNDDFVLGYYVHLFTDYYWSKYVWEDLYKNGKVYTLDGKRVEMDNRTFLQMVYQDYSNINIKLVDEYDLPVNIFYDFIPSFEPIIEEMPYGEIRALIDKMGLILENTKVEKDFAFDLDVIKKFISFTVAAIFDDLKNKGIC